MFRPIFWNIWSKKQKMLDEAKKTQPGDGINYILCIDIYFIGEYRSTKRRSVARGVGAFKENLT